MTKGSGGSNSSGSSHASTGASHSSSKGSTHGGSSGKDASGTHAAMDKSCAANIQRSGVKNPTAATHTSGFDVRAQRAADKNALN